MPIQQAYDMATLSDAARRETIIAVAGSPGLTGVIVSRLLATQGPQRLD
jgi:hypothetical protein